jgi:ParB-like chromosome segregation protein Spo0J
MDIKLNPQNPRIIDKDKFQKLCDSIKQFPKMLELRPIVVDKDGVILGGNMRYKALQELKMDIQSEWIKTADSLTDEERRRFMIEDNLELGEWNNEELLTQYNTDELLEWGFDEGELKIETDDFSDKNKEIDTNELGQDLDIECPKCGFKFKENV